MKIIESSLQSLNNQNLYRNLGFLTGIDFCTNDYLGFAKSGKLSPELKSFSSGSGSSRLIPGHHLKTFEGESLIAQIYKTESTLFFGSGYLANLGVIQAFSHDETEFFSDELNHASIVDGIKLAKGKKNIFKHNDLNELEEMLRKSHSKQKVVITESIFSMDGDGPNLNELIKICNQYNAFIIIDEAHSTGVMGIRGLGLMADLSYNKEMTVIIHTCSKALGCYGAFVTSGKKVRELLINEARTLIYSTALPPIIIDQICFAINESLSSDKLRAAILKNIQFTKEEFKRINLDLRGCHISYFKIAESNISAIVLEQYLRTHNIETKAIRYPSVPRGEERIRITLKSFNTREEIQKLVKTINEIIQ